MHYATASFLSFQSQTQFEGESCSNCNDDMEPQAKFCGSCGYIVAPSSFSISQFPAQARLIDLPDAHDGEASLQELLQPPMLQSLAASMQQPVVSVPEFATTHPIDERSSRAAELKAEGRKITVLLARQKVFLNFLLTSFLAINLFGCWAAWTCYTGFNGDEMSKMVIATTPFLFINLVALVVLAPIKGTKAQISRLKDRLSHNRFKLEFGHLDL